MAVVGFGHLKEVDDLTNVVMAQLYHTSDCGQRHIQAFRSTNLFDAISNLLCRRAMTQTQPQPQCGKAINTHRCVCGVCVCVCVCVRMLLPFPNELSDIVFERTHFR